MDIKVEIEDKFIEDVQSNFPFSSQVSPYQLLENAYALYGWAVNEAFKGRLILSCDVKGNNLIPK